MFSVSFPVLTVTDRQMVKGRQATHRQTDRQTDRQAQREKEMDDRKLGRQVKYNHNTRFIDPQNIMPV